MSENNNWMNDFKPNKDIDFLGGLSPVDPFISKLPEIELAVDPTYELIEKQEEANETLRQIAENTSVLKELVEINRSTQLSTEKLTEIMMEINLVAQAKTKEEADNLLTKAIDKINKSGETVSNIASLMNVLMAMYNAVKPYLK